MTAGASPTACVTPRPASTTLVVRDGAAGLEVLMVRRSARASFMPGSYVFPGGAVDPADDAPEQVRACDESWQGLAERVGTVTQVADRALAHAVAALRECFEECRLWLGAPPNHTPGGGSWDALRARLNAGAPLHEVARGAGWPLAISALQPWGHWVTPVGMPKRFDTLFFVAQATPGQSPAVDAGETTELDWLHPPTALARHARGEIPLEFATVKILESMQPFAHGGSAGIVAHAAAIAQLPPVHPRLRRDADGTIIGVVLPGQPGYDDAGAACG
jgi:8-oxo-dGTP pyrophosphatase MutT (NUDIX family)